MLGIVSQYLEAQMEAGTIQQMDLAVASRAFIGPFTSTMFYQVIWGLPMDAKDHDAIVRRYVDIFLHGAAATPSR
jgi:hypothetical protein